ncbi:MAG TPA: orotidine-5'-phosphate decarboxylase [Anaerohalosphaeraceae bacterium]|nr:orotidine-5'-phosphate decarboxylase [Anaerohalosphaeraceae bacterium]
MASHFGDRLCEAVQKKSTPLIVGLDPVYSRLPEAIRKHKDMNDAQDLGASVDALFEFCSRVMRIVAPIVPAVKINSAYFEKYLWEGMETYYALVSEADALGLEVIGDVKRGDIGHTAQMYAEGHLKNPDFEGMEDVIVPDAVTISGFAGAEGIVPFADMAEEQGKGVFIWVRSSNPTAGALQDFENAAGQKWYEKLAEIVGEIANQNRRIGASGYSNVGMVIGGTSPQAAAVLRQRYPKCWFLVPGYGSQGAGAAECMRFCNKDRLGALINASRSIIYAYEDPRYQSQFGDNWEKCVEQAALDAKMELAKVQI